MKDYEIQARSIESKRPNDDSLLTRIYQARGVDVSQGIDYGLNRLCHYSSLSNIELGCQRLHQALIHKQHIIIVGDYDTDGATSTTLVYLALKKFGHHEVSFVVPNRFEFGYGLTPKLIDSILAKKTGSINNSR